MTGRLKGSLKGSLSAKVFVATFCLLAAVCALTYGLIAALAPITFTADETEQLQSQARELIDTLEHSSLVDCAAILGDFALRYNRTVSVTDEDGATMAGTVIDGLGNDDPALTITAPQEAPEGADRTTYCAGYEFSFADSPDTYLLLVVSSAQPVNQLVSALGNIWPWLLAAILLISVGTSFVYARRIASPIVQLSDISRKLSELDFAWRCEESRTDEIGILARSLNTLGARLSRALGDLRTANEVLRRDIQREREREEAQKELLSAVSHELKTPITILRGQLQGMLDGVGVYADRDRFLARSLDVVRQMESLVAELVIAARLDANIEMPLVPVDMNSLVTECLDDYDDLFQQKRQEVVLDLLEPCSILGEPLLLRKAVGNLLSNACNHSPQGAGVRISMFTHDNDVVLAVLNESAHIGSANLPHLFEPFRRGDPSRNRRTGGSGLGLFLVERIVRRHGGHCRISSTEQGVLAELWLPNSTKTT